ncbi:MAG: hypothetical protein V1735_03670 [Nanoarchaeota archaeon]
MKRSNGSSKGVFFGEIIPIFLGLVVLVTAGTVIFGHKDLKTVATDFITNAKNLLVPDEKPVYNEDLTEDEEDVKGSMEGLVSAVNSVAAGDDVTEFQQSTIQRSEIGIKSYMIGYTASALIQLPNNPDTLEELNLMRPFILENTIVPYAEHFVWADLSDCLPSGNPPTNPQCHVKWLPRVYQVSLIVNYDQGEPCMISIPSLVNPDNEDFLTWGAAYGSGAVGKCEGMNDFTMGDGCDRNGDGIFGEYGLKYVGLDWDATLQNDREGNKKIDFLNNDPAGQRLRELYFPKGKVTQYGEGCFDSPTFLQCKGIRVYYCGKGGEGWMNPNYDQWTRRIGDEFHSAAGAKFLVVFDKDLTEPRTVHSSIIAGDNGRLVIVTPQGTTEAAPGSAMSAAEADATAVVARVQPKLPSSKQSKMDDTNAFCYGGKPIAGDVKVKCDKETEMCSLCGFNLPQQIEHEERSITDYITAYGDPKYIMYFEAFPYGEQESWEVPETEAALISAMKYQAVFTGVQVAATLIGGSAVKSLSKLQKLSRLISKSSRASQAALKAMKVAKRSERAKAFATVFFDYLKKNGDEAAEKIIKQADQAATLPIKKIATEFDDETVQALMGNAEAGGHLISPIEEAVQNSPKLRQALLDFWDKLPTRQKVIVPAAIATQGGLHAAAYALGAQGFMAEESRNELFYNLGVNRVGMKTPFEGAYTLEFDQKVMPYYLSLVRDHRAGGFLESWFYDQADQRFFLASPCKANLALWKDKCLCYPDEKLGIYYVDFIPHGPNRYTVSKTPADGMTPVYSHSLTIPDFNNQVDVSQDAIAHAVKVCPNQNWFQSTFNPTRPGLTVDCIRIDPVILDNTYCYGSSNAVKTIGGFALYGASIAASLATDVPLKMAAGATIACPPVSALVIVIDGVIQIGLDYATERLIDVIERGNKWPNHPGLSGVS